MGKKCNVDRKSLFSLVHESGSFALNWERLPPTREGLQRG